LWHDFLTFFPFIKGTKNYLYLLNNITIEIIEMTPKRLPTIINGTFAWGKVFAKLKHIIEGKANKVPICNFECVIKLI